MNVDMSFYRQRVKETAAAAIRSAQTRREAEEAAETLRREVDNALEEIATVREDAAIWPAKQPKGRKSSRKESTR